MKASQSTSMKVITWLPALLLLGCSGHADPLKPTALTGEAISAKPYSITLSCLAGTETWSPGRPYITLSLTNSTSHTLFFPYAIGSNPNFIVFSIEYKAATGPQNSDRGWVRLVPNPEPVHTSPSSLVLEDITNRERMVIPAGQDGHLSVPPDFPMSKNGFYRISAVLTVPEASEYKGDVPGSTKIRSFELVVRSKPFIIRRTAAGFAEVPAAAGKAVPAH